MNRLPEQLVAWHNRHPLALRITVNDVHTLGIVALPFMRSGGQTATAVPMPTRMIEPVLGDDATAAEPAEAHEPVTGDQSAGRPRTWPMFSERFIEGLSVRRISRFAQACGFATRPGLADWPTREVPADDKLMAEAKAAGGALPLALYLISAAIDASGKQRTRVLIGQGKREDTLAVIGRRCLSRLRVGGLGLALLLLIGSAAAAIWWPDGAAVHEAVAAVATPPASAPMADAASSASPASSASVPMAASEPGLGPLPAPSSAPAPQTESASEPVRDIRPRLVERVHPQRVKQPTHAMLFSPEPASAAASKPLEKVAEAKPDKTAIKSTPSRRIISDDKRTDAGTDSGKPVVALVGLPSAKKADAEVLLERLRAAVEGVRGKSNTPLQATVFQTPEGWCAAVWPFASREEAQIVNATLVARGMRTRAVDF